jgi:hypothetical protein
LVLVWRWVRRDEFWARVEEEFLEGGEALVTVSETRKWDTHPRDGEGKVKDAPPGQLGELVTVSILDDVEDIIVQPARRESVANSE